MNTQTQIHMPVIEKNLTSLYKKWCGAEPFEIKPMQAHGSDRKYFRIFGTQGTVIGVQNDDRKENIAFLSFSESFAREKLPVPEIYAQDIEKGIYLEEDLGDETLFSFLRSKRTGYDFPPEVLHCYKKVVRALPGFQINASQAIDYDVCYPRSSFDKQSMMWDLNYFKYYFLKLAKIPFDEQALEDDFQTFTDYLLDTGSDYFLYRDFQSRNVMLKDGEPFFIDYQGGRKGALQYDIASLLFDAKANIPNNIRTDLLREYMTAVEEKIEIDRQDFMQHYYGFVFIRIMQALGAYGFRGFYERKSHFLKSVPYAIRNLEWLLGEADLPLELPALKDAWHKLVRSSLLRQLGNADLRMTLRIQSFSYKRGIPTDDKGHGGGFVFDCRSLPNPGRYPKYADLTGNDEEVITFLQKEPAVDAFLSHIKEMVRMAVTNYQERNFTDLMVSFGCTGGQHRSVYSANWLAEFVKNTFKLNVEVRHREQEMKK